MSKQVIKFSASWCGPCKIVAPMFSAMAPEFPNLSFVSYDIESEEGAPLVEKYSVMSVPTIVVVDGDEVVAQGSGIPAINQLRGEIEKLNEEGA